VQFSFDICGPSFAVRYQKKKSKPKKGLFGDGDWRNAGSAPVCWQNTVHLIASNKCRLMLLSPDISLCFLLLFFYFILARRQELRCEDDDDDEAAAAVSQK